MQKKSKAGLVAKLIIAPVAYFLITQVISLVYILIVAFRTISASMVQTMDYAEIYDLLMNEIMDQTLMLTLISALVSIPLIYFVFFDKKEKPAGKRITLLYAALFGVGVSIVANVIVSLTGLEKLSETYQELNSHIYTGNVLFEILAAGLIIPIVEELVFRGVILKNLYQLAGKWPALIISSLIFGIMHMNLVQFVYASILGFAMGFVYISYRSILAPILFHMAANTFSIMVSDWDWMHQKMENPIVTLCVIAVCVILTAVCPILIVKNTRKPIGEDVAPTADTE